MDTVVQSISPFIIHYSRAEPFGNVVSSPRHEWPRLLENLSEESVWGPDRFSDPHYLERRLEVESKMREEFVRLGGKPETELPVYFFLGRNHRFETMGGFRGYTIPLKKIPPHVVSFTYGDSLLSFHPDYRAKAGPKYQNPLCGRLFHAQHLSELLRSHQLPKDSPLKIEVQLWMKPHKEMVEELELP